MPNSPVLNHHISSQFNEDLQDVNTKFMTMGGLVEQQVANAIHALLDTDANLAVDVQFKDNAVVERIFKGIRPAVVALIAAPLLMLGKSAKITWKNGWIPVSVALLVWLLGVSPIYIVLGAIVLGILHLVYVKKRLKR